MRSLVGPGKSIEPCTRVDHSGPRSGSTELQEGTRLDVEREPTFLPTELSVPGLARRRTKRRFWRILQDFPSGVNKSPARGLLLERNIVPTKEAR